MDKLDTILLIDDDFTTNFLHKKRISQSEIDSRVEVANNGAEGINKLLALNESIQASNALVLVFLDLNMPIMDGWDFLEAFKELKPKLNFNINLFIVSSSINPDDRARAKNYSQVLDYFPKHLSVATLVKLTENCI